MFGTARGTGTATSRVWTRPLATIAAVVFLASIASPAVSAAPGDYELRVLEGDDFSGGFLTDITDAGYIAGVGRVGVENQLRQPRIIVGSVAEPQAVFLPSDATSAGVPEVNAHGTVATAFTPAGPTEPGVPARQRLWIRQASGEVDDRGVSDAYHVTGFGGIADDGAVAFTTAVPSVGAGGGTPYVVEASGDVIALNDPFDSAYFKVHDINDDFVLGASFADAGDRTGRYVRWNRATGSVERLEPTFSVVTSPAMNRSGQVAGVVGGSVLYDRAVLLWDPSGSYTELEPAPNVEAINVRDIADDGSVLASAVIDRESEILRWDSAGELTYLSHLDDLTDPDRVVSPRALNSSGVLAGSVRSPFGDLNQSPVVIAEPSYVGDPGDDGGGGPVEGAPTIDIVTDPEWAATDWHNGPIDYAFVCDDDVEVVSCSSGGRVTEEGETVVTGTAVDSDGNTTTVTTLVRIDATAPEINMGGDLVLPGDWPWEKWHTTPVEVTPTCSDALSGIAECTAPFTLTESGVHVVTGTAVDLAGNVHSAERTVWIDRTPPVVTISLANPILGPGAVIRGTYSDENGSGAPAPSSVWVTFTNNLTGRVQQGYATSSCTTDRTSCTWSIPRPETPGLLGWLPQSYRVSAVGFDHRLHQSLPASVEIITIL